MLKACLALAFFCLSLALPLQAFDWETATSGGREYVTLHSFCTFYGFTYQSPSGNNRFSSRNAAGHSLSLQLGNNNMYLDGVHYVMSFAIEGGDHDWLVSRMDVIKLFDPILRPTEISARHSIRGVVIDAGHGGSDNGATSRLGAEKNYTLKTAFMLEKILHDAGLKTVLTRRTDVFIDLYERAHIASLYSDYCFVSIHFNSATPEASGLETYCLSPRGAASTSSNYLTRSDIQKLPGNDYDPLNILLASMVHSEIIKLNPGDSTADRGVKRARFVVIKQNVLPAILVEGGFVSNHMEAARVDRDDYRQKLAQDIARGVIRFVNVMGDRNLRLPSGSSNDDDEAPAPKVIPVAPPAPSGMAGESPGVKSKPGSAISGALRAVPTSKTSTSTTTTPATGDSSVTSAHKSRKSKKTTPTPETAAPPVEQTKTAAAAPTADKRAAETTSTTPSSSGTPGGSLNLKEPAVPTPVPGSDKAPAEPDEPPTVNIYSTGPAKSSGASSTNAAPAQPEP